MGKFDLRTVIAPSGYARSSDFQVSSIINGLIGRSLDDCLRNRGMTFDTVILGQQRVTRVSKDVKWTLGSSPRVTGERKSPRVTGERKSPRVTGEEERPWVTIGLIFLGSVSMATMARAECTPTPDCASIGYTESSCDGKFTRCPFNTSKLFCVPCDSSYKYNCIGDNITGGVGSTCGGKYASCTCADGYEWNGSACMVPDCNVGDIYYSDKSCSSSYNSSKTAIGVVIKKNELVLSKKRDSDMYWSNSYVDVSGVTNYESETYAKMDMNGKINTLAIVSTYTSDTTSNNAAKYCNAYTTAGTSAGDWYLPAAGELYTYVYGNYSIINSTMSTLGWTLGSRYFWSSSEFISIGAWGMFSSNGSMGGGNKINDINSVSCFLSIS